MQCIHGVNIKEVCGECEHDNKEPSLHKSWISIETKMPEYYEYIWVTDGIRVFLSRLTGRSYNPPKRNWENHTRSHGGSLSYLYGITHWQPCIAPKLN